MGPLMSSGFGRDGSRPDHGHRFGPGRTRFSVQPCEHAMCAGGTVALLAWSRRPTIPVAATRRTLSGDSSTVARRKPSLDDQRGACHRARIIAPHPCIRQVQRGPDHDAVMRIGGEAPGRRAHSKPRLEGHVQYRGAATSVRQLQPIIRTRTVSRRTSACSDRKSVV